MIGSRATEDELHHLEVSSLASEERSGGNRGIRGKGEAGRNCRKRLHRDQSDDVHILSFAKATAERSLFTIPSGLIASEAV